MNQKSHFNSNSLSQKSTYYDLSYFNWQKNIGAFGGWANSHKFKNSIKESDTVLDFGCGGGYLLQNINCKTRVGIEPNQNAIETIKNFNINHFLSPNDAINSLGVQSVDVIISNHALEHALNPLNELINLKPLLKDSGTIHFFVPCDTINKKYDPDDVNNHLYSWSPQNLGNLFVEAGYSVVLVRPFIHKWPPYYKKLSILGWPLFDLICRIYARIERSYYQVEIVAKKLPG